MDEIKSRLAHILRSKNLTSSQFAEMVGIGPSNVSHLLSGRNKPSFDFIIKLKEVFPEYNLDWIMLGKKPITINDPSPSFAGTMKTEPEQDEPSAFPNDDSQSQTNYSLFDNVTEDVQNQPFTIEKPKIKKIIFVYDDDTFEEIIRR